MIHIIIAIFMGLTIPFMSYLNKQANLNISSDIEELKMPKAYLYMSYLVILISAYILIFPQIIKDLSNYYSPMIWFLIVSVFLFGIYLMRLFYVHKINIKKNEFFISSIFGKQKKFQTNNIKSLNVNYLTYFITIEDKKGNKGKVYFHLINLSKLFKQIKNESGIDISKIESLLKI